MLGGHRWRGVVGIVALVELGCSRQTTFSCEDDEACIVDGVAGQCELNGYCSFPDEDCASGRRYGQQGPAELAGVCVDAPSGSSSGSDPTTGSSTTAMIGSTTDDGESSSSSSSSGAGEGESSSSSTGEPETPPANVVFVSSASLMPSETVVADADALCGELAAGAGIEGTFVSWISTSEVEAISRLEGARGWVRPDGRPFADRPADIVEGRVFYPPVLDEEGTEVRNRRSASRSAACTGRGPPAPRSRPAARARTGRATRAPPGATTPTTPPTGSPATRPAAATRRASFVCRSDQRGPSGSRRG